jgi:RNA polymerase sigma factor (sigma-70 family)
VGVVLSVVEPVGRAVDPAARFDELFRGLYPGLFGLTYRLLGDRQETEDTLQEAFLKLANAAVLQRPDQEVAAWLRRVCLNLGFNRLRDRRRARERLEQAGRLETDAVGDEAADPPDALLRQEARAHVRRILAGLSERQRNCLLLRHSGHSYAEIAATLDVAVGSVGVLLARAERAFRESYEEHDDDQSSADLS